MYKTATVFPSYYFGGGTVLNDFVSENIIPTEKVNSGSPIPIKDSLTRVQTGDIDLLFTTGYYYLDQYEELGTLSGIPFGLTQDEFISWTNGNEGKKYYQQVEAQIKCKIIPVYFSPSQLAGWVNKRIKRLSDFYGLRMRYTGYAAKVMDKIGVRVETQEVNLERLKNNVRRGLLDGIELADPQTDLNAGLHEVCKYTLVPSWHEPSTCLHLIINDNSWNRMTEFEQKNIEKWSLNYTLLQLESSIRVQGKAVTKLISLGTRFITLRESDLRTLNDIWENISRTLSPSTQDIISSMNNLKNQAYPYIAINGGWLWLK